MYSPNKGWLQKTRFIYIYQIQTLQITLCAYIQRHCKVKTHLSGTLAGSDPMTSWPMRRGNRNVSFSYKYVCLKFLTKICDKWMLPNFFQIFCTPNLPYFTSILQKIGSKWLQKTCPTNLYCPNRNKNVQCTSYKYL
jgi:hypothetical protein